MTVNQFFGPDPTMRDNDPKDEFDTMAEHIFKVDASNGLYENLLTINNEIKKTLSIPPAGAQEYHAKIIDDLIKIQEKHYKERRDALNNYKWDKHWHKDEKKHHPEEEQKQERIAEQDFENAKFVPLALPAPIAPSKAPSMPATNIDHALENRIPNKEELAARRSAKKEKNQAANQKINQERKNKTNE